MCLICSIFQGHSFEYASSAGWAQAHHPRRVLLIKVVGSCQAYVVCIRVRSCQVHTSRPMRLHRLSCAHTLSPLQMVVWVTIHAKARVSDSLDSHSAILVDWSRCTVHHVHFVDILAFCAVANTATSADNKAWKMRYAGGWS